MKLSALQIEVDTHTHTIASGHAFSTLDENCRSGAAHKLQGLCMTDHGPNIPGTMPYFAPCSFPALPSSLYGVQIIPGLEFNIIDKNGTVDIAAPHILRNIRFGIASMHDITMPLCTKIEHTDAYIAALQHPHIDILGHPGNAHFEHDPLPIVLEAKRLNKMIEINNSSFTARAGSDHNCNAFAHLCKQHDVKICVASDAHHACRVGVVPKAMQMLEEISFPPELICNLKAQRFYAHMAEMHPEAKDFWDIAQKSLEDQNI